MSFLVMIGIALIDICIFVGTYVGSAVPETGNNPVGKVAGAPNPPATNPLDSSAACRPVEELLGVVLTFTPGCVVGVPARM